MRSDPPLPWIPILMYHRVVPEVTAPDPFGNCITVRAFASHLAWLRRLNFTCVSLDAIAALADDPTRTVAAPRRAFAITFDDGYQDNYDHAWTLLAKYGFTATIFLVSGAIGGYNDFDRANTPERVPMLSAGQVRQMHAAGINFGSHTRSHPRDLIEMPWAAANGEIRHSRDEIEDVIQAPIQHFSYPYTRVHPRLEEHLREAGYRSACAGVGTLFTQFRLSRVFASQQHGPGLVAQMGIRRIKHLARPVLRPHAAAFTDRRVRNR
jgi:peptidoglycan/xylan/chitin deacetylase (PgdA/CDA1 family)